MRAHQKVGVTTTASLDGWEIVEYLGPVVAHTVAGTGFFSDIFAGFSDFFGGRSGTYQKQLRSLSDEVVASLRERAHERRANWVVGLTVDMDEVSGKGMQMFMVTAMGTAVRAVRQRAATSASASTPAATVFGPSAVGSCTPATPAAQAPGSVSHDAVQSATRRFAVVDALTAGTLVYDDATWATLVDERIAEAAPGVLRTYAKVITGAHGIETPTYTQCRQWVLAYFERLGADVAAPALYDALTGEAGESAAAARTIADLKLRDLAAVRRLLGARTFEVRRRAVQVLRAAQRTYSPDDVHYLDAIAAACADEDVFRRVATLVPGTGKGFFGGKDRLVCVCKTERPATVPVCTNGDCQRDAWGFRPGDFTPAAAREACVSEAQLLRRLFAEAGDGVETANGAGAAPIAHGV